MRAISSEVPCIHVLLAATRVYCLLVVGVVLSCVFAYEFSCVTVV